MNERFNGAFKTVELRKPASTFRDNFGLLGNKNLCFFHLKFLKNLAHFKILDTSCIERQENTNFKRIVYCFNSHALKNILHPKIQLEECSGTFFNSERQKSLDTT